MTDSPSRTASLLPIVDFPAPIMPTSTTSRAPRAPTMSASGVGPVLARDVISGIRLSVFLGLAARKESPLKASYTTRGQRLARATCQFGANMLDDFNG